MEKDDLTSAEKIKDKNSMREKELNEPDVLIHQHKGAAEKTQKKISLQLKLLVVEILDKEMNAIERQS